MSHSKNYLNEVIEIVNKINVKKVENIVKIISTVKEENGRIFFLGVGGSAANCSHAVNDFRKIVGVESYAPTDNVSELTARTNDEGWNTVFKEWLKVSCLKSKDLLFILSVGGGNKEKNISVNLVEALNYGKKKGCKIVGIVGRDGGHTAKVANESIIIPVVNEKNTTVHTEAFHAVIWHLLVSHPELKKNETKWEST